MMEHYQQDLPLAGEQILDVVSYWRAKMLEPHWRDLARMALDYLTIPAMSLEPKRVFSAAKITLTDRRCRMGDDAIEALKCLIKKTGYGRDIWVEMVDSRFDNPPLARRQRHLHIHDRLRLPPCPVSCHQRHPTQNPHGLPLLRSRHRLMHRGAVSPPPYAPTRGVATVLCTDGVDSSSHLYTSPLAVYH